MTYGAVVITVSDRSAAGERVDSAGPLAVSELVRGGFSAESAVIVADGAATVAAAIRDALAAGARLIVTTGGTGVGPRDRTPEGTSSVLTRELPGVADELRRVGVLEIPGAMLSRGVAGVVDPGGLSTAGALVVNLPGSPQAVASGMPVILSIARHAIDQLSGGDHA